MSNARHFFTKSNDVYELDLDELKQVVKLAEESRIEYSWRECCLFNNTAEYLSALQKRGVAHVGRLSCVMADDCEEFYVWFNDDTENYILITPVEILDLHHYHGTLFLNYDHTLCAPDLKAWDLDQETHKPL